LVWAAFFAVSVGFNCLGFQYLFFTFKCENVKIINVTNAQLKSSKSEVEDSLRLKEVLLGEVHHRVKNNLQWLSPCLILKRVAINKALLKILLKGGR
jgi:hypothetical protein